MRKLLGVALLLAGCAAEPADMWVGEWDVTVAERLEPCGGGEVTSQSSERTMTIERNAAGPFIAGRCRIGLRVLSATYATVAPGECSFVSDTGAVVEAEYLSGAFDRDGDRLTGAWGARLVVDGVCYTSDADIEGVRRF
jgi:hypothetical protein